MQPLRGKEWALVGRTHANGVELAAPVVLDVEDELSSERVDGPTAHEARVVGLHTPNVSRSDRPPIGIQRCARVGGSPPVTHLDSARFVENGLEIHHDRVAVGVEEPQNPVRIRDPIPIHPLNQHHERDTVALAAHPHHCRQPDDVLGAEHVELN